MNNSNRLDLFRLLPALYRSLDITAGSPLQALMAVMQRQYDAIDANIEQLYDDWFIETCQDWAVPYIGQLVGTDWLLGPDAALEPQRRALVADAIAFARRKGVVPVLQALCWAATGWAARAVEASPHLLATQAMTALRPGQAGYVDIAATGALAAIDTPFDPLFHRPDMATSGRAGAYNLSDIAVYVWRLTAFPLQAVPAAAVTGVAHAYCFDPFGRDLPLFAPPSRPVPDDETAGIASLPVGISRRALQQDLASYRQQWGGAPNPPPNSLYYGPDRGLLITSGNIALTPLQIEAADLGTWPDGLPANGLVPIDPECGRFMLAATGAVTTAYGYGFSAGMGGGPYGRTGRMADPAAADWSITVGNAGRVSDLATALAQWQQAKPATAVITILDNASYAGLPPVLDIDGGSRLVIQAADQQRPSVVLPAPWTVSGAGILELSGLLLQGALALNGTMHLILRDSTMLPPDEPVAPAPIAAAGAGIAIEIAGSIVPPMALPSTATVTLSDSIVDPFGLPAAISGVDGAAGGAVLTVRRCTLLGAVTAGQLAVAEDSIFLAPVSLADSENGTFRYSYAAAGSVLPPAYRAQPQLALAEAAAELGLAGPDQLPPAVRAAVIAAVTPRFTSLTLPQAGYGQLTLDTAPQITGGAGDGGAMGAFNTLNEPQLRRLLLRLLPRFVPLGCAVDPVFVT